MSKYVAPWDIYRVEYDIDGGERTFVAGMPASHEVSGPAGTLIGFLDLVEKVIDAVNRGVEGPVRSAYAWPPVGAFLSTTMRRKPEGMAAPHRSTPVTDDEWFATLSWRHIDENYSTTPSIGLSAWRRLPPALRELMSHPAVRQNELDAAIPVE